MESRYSQSKQISILKILFSHRSSTLSYFTSSNKDIQQTVLLRVISLFIEKSWTAHQHSTVVVEQYTLICRQYQNKPSVIMPFCHCHTQSMLLVETVSSRIHGGRLTHHVYMCHMNEWPRLLLPIPPTYSSRGSQTCSMHWLVLGREVDDVLKITVSFIISFSQEIHNNALYGGYMVQAVHTWCLYWYFMIQNANPA